MYVIAFFTTVILFSASLYIGHKFVYIATHFDDEIADTDFVITPNPYIGAFRKSA